MCLTVLRNHAFVLHGIPSGTPSTRRQIRRLNQHINQVLIDPTGHAQMALRFDCCATCITAHAFQDSKKENESWFQVVSMVTQGQEVFFSSQPWASLKHWLHCGDINFGLISSSSYLLLISLPHRNLLPPSSESK